MLNFSNLPEQREYKKGKFIRPGIQPLILKNISLQTSQNTGTKRPVFSMETEPITDEGWEGNEGAKGQIGDIAGNFGFYMKTAVQEQDFLGNLKEILKATGTEAAFMEKHGEDDFSTIEDAIEAVKPFILGTTARYFVAGEQYEKQGGRGFGLKLKFPSRRLVESLDSETKFPRFDESDPKHFKKLSQVEKKPEPASDLPF